MAAQRPAVPVIAIDQLTEAATAGVLRALERHTSTNKEFLRRPILVGIIIQPPDFSADVLEQIQGKLK